MKPITKRPKGYRSITVDGELWYWTPGGWGIIARNARTGERRQATSSVVDNLVREFGAVWDDRRERPIMTPGHVAEWLRNPTRWETDPQGSRFAAQQGAS